MKTTAVAKRWLGKSPFNDAIAINLKDGAFLAGGLVDVSLHCDASLLLACGGLVQRTHRFPFQEPFDRLQAVAIHAAIIFF